MGDDHVNIHGDRWNPSEAATKFKKKVKTENLAGFHKGWRVEGVPPEALADAQAGHKRALAANEKAGGAALPAFDQQNWLMNAKLKKLRAKPFEIESAAHEMKALAEKAGWLRVQVTEIKKEAALPSESSDA